MKKKQFGRKTAVLLVMALMCQQVPVQAAKAAKVKLSVSECILSKEDSRNLNVQGMDERSGKYQSRNKKIVTVSKNGIIRAKKAGETQIVWTKGKKKLICSVVVVKKPAVSKSEVTVKEGSSEQVSVKMFENKGLKVSWRSADPGIALVKGGTITGVAEGTTQVTAKVTGYTKTYLKNITVIVEKVSEEAASEPVSPMAPVLPGDSIPEDWTGSHLGVIGEISGGGVDAVNPTVPELTGPSDQPIISTGDSVNVPSEGDYIPGNMDEENKSTESSSSTNAGLPVTEVPIPPSPAPDTGSGDTGSAGGSEDTGSTGGSGDTGSTGGSGDTGSAGGSGDTGSAGGSGDMGSTGGSGDTGSTGDRGDTGSAGGSGDTDSAGDRGDAGSAGGSGDTDSTGGSGDAGSAGDSGDTDSAGGSGDAGSAGDSGEGSKNEENKQPEESDSTETVPTKTMAEQVLEIVNQERAKQGLSALTLDMRLTACAELRAEELKEVFSHERPDGTSCFSVLDENNILYFTCGENIAYGYRTAQSVMNGWMNSAGHRANILNEDFGKIGVGYFKDGGNTYWVQMFTD